MSGIMKPKIIMRGSSWKNRIKRGAKVVTADVSVTGTIMFQQAKLDRWTFLDNEVDPAFITHATHGFETLPKAAHTSETVEQIWVPHLSSCGETAWDRTLVLIKSNSKSRYNSYVICAPEEEGAGEGGEKRSTKHRKKKSIVLRSYNPEVLNVAFLWTLGVPFVSEPSWYCEQLHSTFKPDLYVGGQIRSVIELKPCMPSARDLERLAELSKLLAYKHPDVRVLCMWGDLKPGVPTHSVCAGYKARGFREDGRDYPWDGGVQGICFQRGEQQPGSPQWSIVDGELHLHLVRFDALSNPSERMMQEGTGHELLFDVMEKLTEPGAQMMKVVCTPEETAAWIDRQLTFEQILTGAAAHMDDEMDDA